MKKRIKLTESQLRNIVTESVKKILKENEEKSNSITKYYWSIGKCNEELEVLSCVEDSSNSTDAEKPYFKTPDEAYKDGLRNLEMYNDDLYMLEVYYFTSSGAGEYASGYMAVCNYGKIKEY